VGIGEIGVLAYLADDAVCLLVGQSGVDHVFNSL
jgi:hypothetical protein